MSLPLLSTKLHVPRARPRALIRPRLTEKLLAGVKTPGTLVLLSGPAGFGKTTLLSTFAAEFPSPLAWVSLDESDNDPSRFWTYLITACQSIHREVGASGLALLQSPQPMPNEALPTLLINDIANLSADLVIILDDYHVVHHSAIHSALAFLLDHLPENLHIVISTRVDPPWPLARLRARDQLTELRAADMRFTVEETAIFLNEVMGLSLSLQDAAALEARTEGWIASLQLAAISMKGHSNIRSFINAFTGSNVYVAEYLMEEILLRQPAETTDFLLRTCILQRLQASLCQAVTGVSESQTMLKELYQSNLFLTPLDEEGQWFRYHQLFAELLRARLSLTISTEEILVLHRRAMAWFESNGFVIEAIHHALAAQDFDAAARLVDRNAYQVMTRGELSTLLRWTGALPDDSLQRYPSILIKKAWALTLSGAIREVEPLLQQAESQVQRDDRSQSALELRGNAAAIRAFFAMMMGEYSRALELARHAEALLPQSQAHISWLVPFTLGSVHRGQGEYEKAVDAFTLQAQLAEKYGNLILWATGVTEVAIVRRLQGRLREAARTCHEALQKIADQGAIRFGSLAKLEVPLIEVLCEQNELEEAHRRLTDVLARMQNWPMPTDRIFAYLAQIRVQQARGDLSGAFQTLRNAMELKAKHPVLASLARSVDLSEIRLYLASKQTATAERLLEALQPGTSSIVSLREQELMMLARIHLLHNQPDVAEQILSPLADQAEAGGRNGPLIEILNLLARAWDAKGDRQNALSILTKALLVAEAEGFIRSFVDEGEAMRRLLTELSGILEASTDESSVRIRRYAARLLSAFPEVNTAPTPSIPADRQSGLIDPLTTRELDVLQLIAAGDSNQAIAERLFITVSAVKKHTGNIFGKLSVNSRTQAVARARQLGLLASDQ
jgi:LuxR family maltose regulon positive regulatory protein